MAPGRSQPYVAVVGPGAASSDAAELAEGVGAELARRGAVVVCGGLGGVMEAACRGAKSAGGTTVGILPGTSRADGNEWLDVTVATGLGEARNALVVRSSDAVIAVAGEFGTLSEIAFALKAGKPVVGIGTWRLERDGLARDPIERAADPRDAVRAALAHLAPG